MESKSHWKLIQASARLIRLAGLPISVSEVRKVALSPARQCQLLVGVACEDPSKSTEVAELFASLRQYNRLPGEQYQQVEEQVLKSLRRFA